MKIINSSASKIAWISAWLGKNYGFFIIECKNFALHLVANDEANEVSGGISSFDYQFHINRLKNRISKLNKLEENTGAEKK